MLKILKFLSLNILLITSINAQIDIQVENSNFILSQPSIIYNKTDIYNYNRLRLRSDWKDNNFFTTAIGDVVNYIGVDYISQIGANTPFSTQTSIYSYDNGAIYSKLYRLYAGV